MKWVRDMRSHSPFRLQKSREAKEIRSNSIFCGSFPNSRIGNERYGILVYHLFWEYWKFNAPRRDAHFCAFDKGDDISTEMKPNGNQFQKAPGSS
jgi:hypothetical protein